MDYPAPEASAFVSFGIALIALSIAVLFLVGVARVSPRRNQVVIAALAIVAWLGVSWLLAANGVLARFDATPPPFVFVFLLTIGGGIALGLSKLGERLAMGLPLALLVGVQAFRLPLEIVMHRAALEGVMPVAMSFSGYNFDIVTGTSALVLAPLIALGRAPRAAIVVWNVFGIFCLCVIAGVAFASSPLVRAFGDAPQQVNSWVAHPPFIWLPVVLVLAAIAGHIAVARRLLAERSAGPIGPGSRKIAEKRIGA